MLTRRDAIKTFGAAPALIKAQSRSTPHLLMLMADQHRADWLGAAGLKALSTPNLDRIASEGIRFTNAYSSTPTCTPARAALLTGLSPWNHGMLGYARVAEKYPIEMPRALRNAGYYTAGIGKMHWHPQRNMHGFHEMLLDESGRAESPDFISDYRAWFKREAPSLNPDETGIGWNDYKGGAYKLPERLHPTRWTGDRAVDFINGYRRNDPFFLKVSFARPHSPYDPPQRLLDKYMRASLPKPAVGAWAVKYEPRNSQRDDIWHGKMPDQEIALSRAAYAGSVEFIDEQIGRILESLEKRRLLDETLVLYFSDHGDMTGDHNLWRKSYAYEASAKIPMMMRWPKGMTGAKRGSAREHPVEIRDVLPTLLDAAGALPDTGLDGRSMLHHVSGKLDGWRQWIDLEHDVCYSPSNHWNSLTDGRVKYIFHAQTGEEQLFVLTEDPHELRDRSADETAAPLLRLWRSRMTDHLAPRGDKWVSGGRLVPRPTSTVRSPNYPALKA